MRLLRRTLDAVTLRRLVGFLLIAGFAQEIFSFVSWLASVAWELGSVSTLRAFLLATVRFALEVTLIYLALRGLGSLLERRRRGRPTITTTEPPARRHSSPTSPEEVSGAGSEAPGRPGEGGGNGRGPDYF
jgi:hypothetical protein